MIISTESGQKLVDPTTTTTRGDVRPAARLKTLEGARLGLLANGKTHGELLLELVVEELRTRSQLGPVVSITKNHPSEPPSQEQVEQFVTGSDAVLSAIGDCGSCSSCTVVDGITFERAGIPTVVLVTEPFEPTVRAIADLNGASWYQPVMISHPVTSLDREQLRERAIAVAGQVERTLLGKAEETSEGAAAGARELNAENIDQVLEPFRTGLRSDNADLVLEAIGGRQITLRLEVGATTCGDCIMPTATIERIARSALSEQFGDDLTVHVIDARTDELS